MALLRLSGVSRSYHDRSNPALAEIDLQVEAGEFIAIVGTSGSGKSTLLNILGLLDRPDQGSYTVADVDVDSLREVELDELRSTRFGFVFQNSHMLGERSVAENVVLPLSQTGVPPVLARQRVEDALAQVGMLGLLDASARTLSGGEQQRVAIARALVMRPDVVLADEPTGSLDSVTSSQILDVLRALVSQGTSVIVVTHDPSVAKVADRVIQLRDGRVESDEPRLRNVPTAPEQVSRGRRREARVGRWRLHRLLHLWSDALGSALSRRTRSLLVVASFALGVGALAASVGIGETAANQVRDSLTSAALDQLYVVPAMETAPQEYEALLEQIRAVNFVRDAGVRVDIAPADADLSPLSPRVRRAGAGLPATTIAASSSYVDFAQYDSTAAAWMLDAEPFGKVALVGRDVADSLGYAGHEGGRTVWAAGEPYQLVGVLSSDGAATTVVLSGALEAASLRSGTDAAIVVQTVPGYPARVAEFLIDYLPPGTQVTTVADLDDLRLGIQQDLGTAVATTAVVVLLLAMLGAATTMTLTVQSRTAEISLRRAIGASRKYIRAMFILEGGVLGLFGGAIGAGIGVWAAIGMATINEWAPQLSLTMIPLGITAGLVTGFLASLLPAQRAAGLEPALGLRHD